MVLTLGSVASVFTTIGYIILAVLALMFMIVVHEFGHFIAGRKLGFKVNEFSIGFGPAIFKKKFKDGLQFSIRPIPLGGYCAFEGEEEDRDKEVKGAFNNQAPWKRIIVLFMGAFFNFVSAVIILTIFFSIWGQPLTTVVGVFDNSVSSTNEWFKPGDAILSVDGKMANVLLANDNAFNSVKGDSAEFRVLRDGKVVKFTATKGEYTSYEFCVEDDWIVYAENDGAVNAVKIADSTQYTYLGGVMYKDADGTESFYRFSNHGSKEIQALLSDDSVTVTQIVLYRYFDENKNSIDYEAVNAITDHNNKAEITDQIKYYVDNVYISLIPTEETSKPALITTETSDTVTVYNVNLYTGANEYGNIDVNGASLATEDLLGFTSMKATQRYGFGVNTGTYLVRLNFFRALSRAVPYTFFVVFKILASLGLLFQPGGLSQAGGPITVVKTISDVAQQGFYNLFWIICILSANLAVMNLLPLPALDGSKIVFTFIEWIRGKPLNRKVEAVIHTVGIIVLFTFTIFLDIFHLAGG